MPKILLIGKNENFFQLCARKLRRLGYKVFIHKDVMDGLREMMLFGVSCIVWDVELLEQNRTRKLDAIKRYHRSTPLIIIDSNRDAYQESELDSNILVLSDNPGIDKIVHEIIDAMPTLSTISDEDRIERLEKEYGFID